MAAAMLLFSSCAKDDTVYDTPTSDKGVVTVSVPGLSAGDNYILDMDGKTSEIMDSIFTCPDLLTPGTYSLVVYNRVDGFTFDGRTARVNTLDDLSRADGTIVISQPGYLKTFSQDITVTAGDTLRVSPSPVQRVRDLVFELEVPQGSAELIQSVTAILSGIAGAFDMEAEQTTGEAVDTKFSFTRDGNILRADTRLLGTMGAVQTLVLDIVFTDGRPTQHTEVDLADALADFNGDMTTIYRVEGYLETPVGMEKRKAEITGWGTVDGDSVREEMDQLKIN